MLEYIKGELLAEPGVDPIVCGSTAGKGAAALHRRGTLPPDREGRLT